MKRRALLFTITVVLLLAAACGAWLWQAKRQYALNRALITALIHDDTKTALALVNAGADPNTRFAPPPAPTFKFLLDQLLHHSHPPADWSPTALMMACSMSWNPPHNKPYASSEWAENLPLLQAMLAHGANVHARTENNRTALHTAVGVYRWHTVEVLLTQGAEVNAQDNNGETPLMFAIWDDTANIARLLLSQGANPNVQNTVGNTALYYAVAVPDRERVIAELLAHRANPNHANQRGETPIALARQQRRPDIVDLLRGGDK